MKTMNPSEIWRCAYRVVISELRGNTIESNKLSELQTTNFQRGHSMIIDNHSKHSEYFKICQIVSDSTKNRTYGSVQFKISFFSYTYQ